MNGKVTCLDPRKSIRAHKKNALNQARSEPHIRYMQRITRSSIWGASDWMCFETHSVLSEISKWRIAVLSALS